MQRQFNVLGMMAVAILKRDAPSGFFVSFQFLFDGFIAGIGIFYFYRFHRVHTNICKTLFIRKIEAQITSAGPCTGKDFQRNTICFEKVL